ncbi:hypothetical protein CSKR_103056 [Clonorchis sinensis]|uniref:Uncharacterized protein n=1 Tax=Clonorchis sinensis TaxID=79923 RepID=A0A419Q8F3_CLOSI|nr:hypothetical protein CSKR_103056 [Clonorchis sinensis]
MCNNISNSPGAINHSNTYDENLPYKPEAHKYCFATQKKHEGWDTARLPKPRQGKSRGRGRARTTDPLVSKLAL